MATRTELRAALDREGFAFVQLEEGCAWLIVVPRLGARILGAGLGEENALWVAPGFSVRGWDEGGNAGGARTWIAPEIGPNGFFGSDAAHWHVPPELDPGGYLPVTAGGKGEGWHAWRTELLARAADGSAFPVAITRAVRLLASRGPGRPGDALCAELRHTLENTGHATIGGRIGLWCIVQVPSARRGFISIPLRRGVKGEFVRPYFTSLPRGVLRARRGTVHLRAQGGLRYKIGVNASAAEGTISFLGRSRTGRGRIRVSLECLVDPCGVYLDRPPAIEGTHEVEGPGDAIQAYNGPGTGAMAFSEIEVQAPAVTLAPGERQVFDVMLRVDHPAWLSP